MSKEILSALVQLFAIFAKQDDGVTEEERKLVGWFLRQQLNKKSVEEYLAEFDKHAGMSKNTRTKRRSMVSDSTKTLRICGQINKELTHVQKIIVTFNLLEMIAAGGTGITVAEDDFLTTAVDIFNIQKEEFESIREFILSSKLYEVDQENVLLLDALAINDKEHTRHIKIPGLEGVMGVLRITSADIYLIRYLGPQELQLNGMGIRSHKTYVFPNGSTIRNPKTSTIYYSDVVTEFLKDETPNPLSFVAENIQYRFANQKLGLRGVDIKEGSGKLVGIMGASGSGKSTLLNVLNGTEKPSEGSVRINGIDIHQYPKKIEGVIGHIPQDDLLMENLTVFENLYFSAKLCFKDKSKKEIVELVQDTLAKIGLTEIQDLKVGSVLEKMISGGQRKRVNIALELLREPAILFVDEPTSGLSSRDSENIMDLLKELSLSGKLIFVVIHQPASDIFKLFDQLLIMDTGGYPIYYGNPIDSLIYFKQEANQINAEQGECNVCGNVNPEQIFNIVETHVVDEYGNFTEERRVGPEDWNEAYKVNRLKREKEHSEEPEIESEIVRKISIPSLMSQWIIFMKRDVLSKIANKQYLLINFLEAPVLAILLAYIIRYYNASEGNQVYSYAKNENVAAYIFMSIIVALFMGLTVSAEEIINDRRILKRERFLNLSWLSYLYSKVGILFFLSAVQTLTFVLIGNTILGIQGMYFHYWFMLFSISCFANLLGLNISASFRSVVTIYILIPLLLIPQIILSGVVVNFDKLNPSLSSVNSVPLIGDAMASRWAFEGIAVQQARNNDYTQQMYPFDQKLAQLNYGKIYHLPHLKKDLDYCVNHLGEPITAHKINVLHSEISKISDKISGAEFAHEDELTLEKFDAAMAEEIKVYLDQIKHYYILSYNDVIEQKQAYLRDLNAKDPNFLQNLKKEHYNVTLDDMVQNAEEDERIFEDEGELLQKIYQIYQEPRSKNLLDYRAQFYLPQKHFMGVHFDTFWFNLSVIWFMCFTLFIMLYFNLLEKLVAFIERLRFGLPHTVE